MAIITVRDLQAIGRFGNQCFLYCFAKGYARAMGCELQTQDWVGRSLFVNATEPLVSAELPQTEVDNASSKPLLYFAGQKDIDLKVFGQHEKYLAYYTRADVRSWLQLKPEFDRYVPDPAKPYSACHLRRGDYINSQSYCEVSEASYDQAIRHFNIPGPVIKIYEGWRLSNPELAGRGMDWLEDFLLLRGAAHLLRGNSSFSVWAAWLGCGKVYSPVVSNKVGLQECDFAIGNWPCTAGSFQNQSDLALRES